MPLYRINICLIFPKVSQLFFKVFRHILYYSHKYKSSVVPNLHFHSKLLISVFIYQSVILAVEERSPIFIFICLNWLVFVVGTELRVSPCQKWDLLLSSNSIPRYLILNNCASIRLLAVNISSSLFSLVCSITHETAVQVFCPIFTALFYCWFVGLAYIA